MENLKCKFCGAKVKVKKFPKFYDMFCPTVDSFVCPYPPFITGADLSKLKQQWLKQFQPKEGVDK